MLNAETKEKDFEEDIAAYFWSPAGGYTRNADACDPALGLFPATLVRFVKATQPKAWKRFENMLAAEPEKRFCRAFANACEMDGVLHVLRHGFKHRGVAFRVCYFKPESELNELDARNYKKNELTCNRQWFYSARKRSFRMRG